MGAGCDATASVAFVAGPANLELAASTFSLPESLREGSGSTARLRSAPCGPSGMCPTLDPPTVTFVCEDNVCDPSPKTVMLPAGAAIDFEEEAGDLNGVIEHIDSISLDRVEYVIEANTLSIAVPDLEVFWGPEGATTIDTSAGVQRLGVLPSITVGETQRGDVMLDAAGAGALGAYLVSTSYRVRFFVRTRIDLEPGGAWPAGALRMGVVFTATATGSLVE